MHIVNTQDIVSIEGLYM